MRLADRLRSALAAPHQIPPVLFAADQREPEPDAPEVPMPAAVLVAVTDRTEPGLILTRRTDSLRRHAGQVAFPGGRIDPQDADAAAAALREAQEEIGLDPSAVELVGHGDPYRTITGFEVQPVLGVIPPGLSFRPEPGEVAAVFEIPFAFALDPANHVEMTVEWQGQDRRYFEINWDGHRIWGATAAMLVNLSRRLRWA
jgi:8-oxo-dGTP pyrophosphatase MutT (NUDIX family)